MVTSLCGLNGHSFVMPFISLHQLIITQSHVEKTDFRNSSRTSVFYRLKNDHRFVSGDLAKRNVVWRKVMRSNLVAGTFVGGSRGLSSC